ncbi:MAG: short-chain-enoyl-CoA hydratase [Deferrisomatales bacterium]
MAYENVLLDQPEAGIYRLTINRPKALNALNSKTLDEIAAAVADVAADPGARALLITGAGDKAFVAGADITEMRDFTALEAKAFSLKGLRVFRAIETLPVPVIAVVNGYCLGGGCELAMSCDWIVASDKARFGQPEVSLGVTPGFGGTQRLTRLVGPARATELVTTGRQVKADEALSIGLVTRVVPADALQEEALQTARAVAAQGPAAVRLAKEAIQRGQDLDLDNACLLEAEVFALCFSTADQKEGMGAFVEKRKARFQGK